MFRKNNNHTIIEEKLLDERIQNSTVTFHDVNFSANTDGKRLEDLCAQYLKDFEDKGLTIREVERLTDMLMQKAYHAVLRQKRRFKFTYLP